MSKIGKKKIIIPKEVNLSINADGLDIKGPLGSKKIDQKPALCEVYPPGRYPARESAGGG